MLAPEYRHTIDDKGRLSIPSKIRSVLGESFVLTKGIGETCLFIYTLDEWRAMEDKIKSLPLTNKKARSFERFFVGGASECVIDKQGRIMVPPALRDHAGLSKDVVIVALTSRYEIWDSKKWDSEAENFDPEEDMESLGI